MFSRDLEPHSIPSCHPAQEEPIQPCQRASLIRSLLKCSCPALEFLSCLQHQDGVTVHRCPGPGTAGSLLTLCGWMLSTQLFLRKSLLAISLYPYLSPLADLAFLQQACWQSAFLPSQAFAFYLANRTQKSRFLKRIMSFPIPSSSLLAGMQI